MVIQSFLNANSSVRTCLGADGRQKGEGVLDGEGVILVGWL